VQNDRLTKICTAGSRKATHWNEESIWWSEFIAKLQTPARSTETIDEYLHMSKGKQDELKDRGGFVYGTLRDGRRKAGHVIGRDVLSLDMDSIPAGAVNDLLCRFSGLGCGYVVYSTRKHHDAAPRLRLLVLMDRTITADEYEPITRKLAQMIGMEFCDPTTFEASRLMYWPSCCSDSPYVYQYSDMPMLSADGMLSLYTDWHNVTEWPQVPGTQDIPKRLAAKQGDPLEKSGTVGAFCKIYDIYRAMDELIPGTYLTCDIDGRYTFVGGSTTGGAVLYDQGKFLFSHHATDPCSGKLVNAFDLVRLHRFAALDDEAKADTPTNKLPSYTAMCQFAQSLDEVSFLVGKERYEAATQEFSNTPADEADPNWTKLIKRNQDGIPLKITANVAVHLEHDPLLIGKIKKDLFADCLYGCAPLPWGKREKEDGPFRWSDEDDAGLRMYFEKVLSFRSKEIVEDALKNHAAKFGYNPVTDYLQGLEWDGIKRLDTLFIDYLGAADTDYTRAVTRKAFTAAVSRAMVPGNKFDTMTILTGAQGIGKSTLLKKMGRFWFSDSIKTFEGKEASELVQGVWIVEIGELEAMNRTEVGRIKQFLSQQEDIYRAAYGRNVGWHPRRCVFFGTSNNDEYLRDRTGNRRFWPLDVGLLPVTKNVFTDLDDEVDQLWAEAFVRWQVGEPLYLSGALEKDAQEQQEDHRESSAREGLIREFVERPVPGDWLKRDLDARRMFWSGSMADSSFLLPRDRICALEIWTELFGGDYKGMKYADAQEINNCITYMPGWKRTRNGVRFGYCGFQRGFENRQNEPQKWKDSE